MQCRSVDSAFQVAVQLSVTTFLQSEEAATILRCRHYRFSDDRLDGGATLNNRDCAFIRRVWRTAVHSISLHRSLARTSEKRPLANLFPPSTGPTRPKKLNILNPACIKPQTRKPLKEPCAFQINSLKTKVVAFCDNAIALFSDNDTMEVGRLSRVLGVVGVEYSDVLKQSWT